jgi:hypothetical protein
MKRVIQTTQDQFESEIRAGTISTLDDLNRYFQAWLHMQCHATVHSETRQAPRERFEASTRCFRHVNMAETSRLFHLRERRRVDPTHSDVQLHKRFYAARPEYRGDRVLVSYDPFTQSDEVELYSLTGVFRALPRHCSSKLANKLSPRRCPSSSFNFSN